MPFLACDSLPILLCLHTYGFEPEARHRYPPMSKLFGQRSLENAQTYEKVVGNSKWKAVAIFPTLNLVDKSR